MTFSLKEQVQEWRSKAEENTLKRQDQQVLNEAKELQRLRTERLRLEGEGQRKIWKEQEISKTETAKREIAEMNRLKSQRSKEKWAKAVAFVGRVVRPRPKPIGEPVSSRPKLSLFNPPNVFSGQKVREMGKTPQTTPKTPSKSTPRVSLFNPQNVWSGKRV
jgi:ABC-type phosphate transport system auxiliary subunit